MAMPPNRAWLGSSPHGRGKLRDWWGTSARLGLIPARAGKTLSVWQLEALREAHPRVGGENALGNTAQRGPPGSSPRGRGKPKQRPKFLVFVRLIPA